MNVTTIGVDLAKTVFQLHGVDARGEVVFRRKLRRSTVLDFLRDLPPCLVGLEACATAHFWGREIGALGHEVRLIPPAYVKPYVRRQKNDAADAEAICEAVTRLPDESHHLSLGVIVPKTRSHKACSSGVNPMGRRLSSNRTIQ